MSANMLTEPKIVMDSTESSDTLPISFITTDDGHMLFAVNEREDDMLEIMTAPITVIPQRNVISSLIKTIDGNFILHSPVFQLNIEGVPEMQQTNLLPVTQHIENEYPIEQLKLVQNVNEHGDLSLLCSRDIDDVLLDKEEEQVAQSDNQVKSNSVSRQDVYKRSPGRPKKIGNTPSLRCDICGQEFIRQTLYRRHMENHAAEKPHRCPKCPASFNIPLNFTLHMATHNTGEPKCPECGRKYARMASLKSHMLLHEKEENLFCAECEDGFSTKAQLDAHLKLHEEKGANEEGGARKCKLCNKQFVQPALYRLHIREHYRLQTKIAKQTKKGVKHKTVYKCTICLKFFQKPSQLMRHIRVHTGEKPFKCAICNRAFTQKSSLQIHMWQHKGIRPHSCNLCTAKFSQKGNLKAHVLRVHNATEGEPSYACLYCACVFKKLGSLNGHVKRVHSNVPEESDATRREITTETANSGISSEADMRATVDSVISQLASLESTVNNTTVDNPTKTTVLNAEQNDILHQALKNSDLPNEIKTTSTKESKKTTESTTYVTILDKTANGTSRNFTIKQHYVGNVRWYTCLYCPKEFKKPSDLIRHLRVHTQEKPFKCMYCVRSFALKSTMIAHERTHSGLKKYACNSCNKSFACHNTLTAHMRLHTKPHKCSICDMSFSSSTVLRNHARSHAREKPKVSPETESLMPQVVLQEPLVISDADNKISVARVQSKQKQMYERSVGVARPHECSVCHAAFRKVSHLKQHFRRHTGERPYKCNKCDRRFSSNSVLKSHLHTHEAARPYSCSVCSTKFSTQSSMKRHLVTHSNKRPFMCPYCHKTFKTYVNCRKHMKIHKHELAQQQLEVQKIQETQEKQQQPPPVVDKATSAALPEATIALPENMEVSFQQQIVASDFTHAFAPDQFQSIADADKEKTFLLTDTITSTQNLSVETTNLDSSQTTTLHADETGTITLPQYTGDQTLTPENIREIEETLNQQLFGIGMNLGVGGANGLSRQMDEANMSALDGVKEPPVLNIIYDHNKSLDASGNASIFTPQFDTFDISQITLQANNEMEDIGLNPSDVPGVPSKSADGDNGGREETDGETVASVAAVGANLDASQVIKSAHLMLISPKENCSELIKLSHVSPQKYSKPVKTADTASVTREMQVIDTEETSPRKSNAVSCESERSPSSIFMDNFQSAIQSEMLISSDVDSLTTKIISECNTLLQCHMCNDQGFTTEGLKEHLKSHRGAKEFECSECSQRFCTSGGLSRHMKMHTYKQQWKCAVCQKVLGSKMQLKFHSKMHTEGWDVSFELPTANPKELISASNDDLPASVTLDVRIDPDSSVSEKVLMDAFAEKKSIELADENAEKGERKEYVNKCKYCPKTFRKPSDLIRHIRTHTGERPYKCARCGKSFAVKCTLDSHMKVHTGKKTFCCHVCTSMFATKGSLKVHMRLHTGSKPFKCPICDMRFRTSGHKKMHMLKHAREHKGGARRKPKHVKYAAVAEAAANFTEKLVANGSPNCATTETTTTTTTTTTVAMTTTVTNETTDAPTQNLDYSSAEHTSVNLDNAIQLPNQIAFNQSEAETLLNNNNNPPVLSVSENSELVTNLQFLLANGFVTIQTDDALLAQSAATNGDSDTVATTNVIEFVNPNPFQETCDLSDTANHVVITSQVPTTTTTHANDTPVIQMSDCVSPIPMMEQNRDSDGNARETKQLRVQSTTTTTTTKTQPSSRKECDVCGKTFTKPYQLERHKRSHTGERPYKCEQCGKGFAQKFTLHLHQKHHTGDRPYPCPHCKQWFSQKGNLQTHLKRVHKLVLLDLKKVKSSQQPLTVGTLLQNGQVPDNNAKLVNLDDILVVDFLK